MRKPDWMEIGSVIGLTVALGLLAPGPRLSVHTSTGPTPAAPSQAGVAAAALPERTPESTPPITRPEAR